MLRWILAVACLVALAPAAQATPLETLLPPTDLQGEYNGEDGTILLEWQPPGDDTTTSYTYTVYRNAEVIGETQDTRYEANLTGVITAFQVTAWFEGNESAPSEPIFAQQQSSSGNGGGGNPGVLFAGGRTEFFDGPCPIVSTFINPNAFPYVFVVIREECIPVIGDTLNIPDPVDAVWWG